MPDVRTCAEMEIGAGNAGINQLCESAPQVDLRAASDAEAGLHPLTASFCLHAG